jgi:hypothetical protein
MLVHNIVIDTVVSPFLSFSPEHSWFPTDHGSIRERSREEELKEPTKGSFYFDR